MSKVPDTICLGGKYSLDYLNLRAYADASFADCKETRCSTAGHVVMLASGLVYWKSARQIMVTTLTTEAEFINLTPTGLSLIWIANLVKQMNGQQKLPLLLYTDSRNA